jgi:hypothetical protein
MRNKRSTVGAILGASILTLSLASAAFAEVLVEEQAGTIAGWDSDGEPFAENNLGDPFGINTEECTGIAVDPDDILFIFDQTGEDQDLTVPNPGGTSANLLDVDLNDGEIFLEDVEAEVVDADSVDWHITVDPPGEELELVSANSNVDGGELVLVAICMFVDRDTATGPAAADTPGDGPWPLILALGLLLASVVLLSPSRRLPDAPTDR